MHSNGVRNVYILKELIESKSPLANRIDRAIQTQVDIIMSRFDNPSPDESYPLSTTEEVDEVSRLFGICMQESADVLEKWLLPTITDIVRKNIRKGFSKTKKTVKFGENDDQTKSKGEAAPNAQSSNTTKPCPLCMYLIYFSFLKFLSRFKTLLLVLLLKYIPKEAC